jgi:hypothetical protein
MRHEDAIVLYGTAMEIHMKNIFQQITGKVGHTKAIIPQWKGKETGKDLLEKGEGN